jgi:hypothetical protein
MKTVRAAQGSGEISLWRIEADPVETGRIVMRDEAGDARFASRDGGRSWERLGSGARGMETVGVGA